MKPKLPLAGLASGTGPLYRRLERLVESAVAEGVLGHGDALPAEREIAEAAGISRVTVRKAIDRLVERGLAVRRRGAGTFIHRPVPAMQQPLRRLTSFTQDMQRRGLVPGSRWLDRGLSDPSPEETMVLGLGEGDQVARLERLRTADGTAIALERTSVPADLLPDPLAVEDSLYGHLSKSGLRAVRANQRISAVLLGDRECRLLGLPPGSPALSVQRVAYLQTGRVMEVSRALYRHDLYDLVAELTIGPQQEDDR